MQMLNSLLRSIDDARNIIFVHADRKWKAFDPLSAQEAVSRAELHILPERIRVTWGGASQIETELALLEAAVQRGEWSYCHLLSGQDICLKTQDEIHAFFDAHDEEFLTFCGEDWNERAQERVRYYYPESGANKPKILLARVGKAVQKLLHVDRRRHDGVQWVGGSNWASLTFDFAAFLLSHKNKILQRMKKTYCADELYKQTIAYNSKYRDRVYLLKISKQNDDTDPAMHLANMRLIDWVRGGPYIFTEEDLPALLSSPCMFARKATPELSKTMANRLNGR